MVLFKQHMFWIEQADLHFSMILLDEKQSLVFIQNKCVLNEALIYFSIQHNSLNGKTSICNFPYPFKTHRCFENGPIIQSLDGLNGPQIQYEWWRHHFFSWDPQHLQWVEIISESKNKGFAFKRHMFWMEQAALQCSFKKKWKTISGFHSKQTCFEWNTDHVFHFHSKETFWMKKHQPRVFHSSMFIPKNPFEWKTSIRGFHSKQTCFEWNTDILFTFHSKESFWMKNNPVFWHSSFFKVHSKNPFEWTKWQSMVFIQNTHVLNETLIIFFIQQNSIVLTWELANNMRSSSCPNMQRGQCNKNKKHGEATKC